MNTHSNSKSIRPSNSKTFTTAIVDKKMTDERKEIEKDFISHVSSIRSVEGDSSKERESPFLLTASQINTDFTVAGQREFEGDLSLDDPNTGFFDLHRSEMYWKLRETFIEDTVKGDEYAFMTAIWRAYNAGRVSPNRFMPDSR